MPTQFTAQPGDCLCGLAIRFGFVNCQPLRDANAGAEFLSRQLRPGDVVTIPDFEQRVESGRAVETLHEFVLETAPPATIRFVHGTPNLLWKDDPTTEFLNVSNYVTTRGGTQGTQGQQFPRSGTRFNDNAHQDPDSFKVEVVDPQQTGSTVDVFLQTLKPIYNAAGAVTGHEEWPSADADHLPRMITLQKVSDGSCFRSPYQRLVTTTSDQTTPDGTSLEFTLPVLDRADGNNTANDKVEILDQLVEASYTRPTCPGSPKCQFVARVPIGPRRTRIKIAVHVVRLTPGGGRPTSAGSAITDTMIRRRVLKNFRRIFAQAELAPKIVEITDHDPPSADMLVIGGYRGLVTSGTATGGGASALTFTISQPPPAAASPTDPNINVPLAPGMTPDAVADAVVAAVNATGTHTARKHVLPRAFNGVNEPVDVFISRTDGAQVAIINERLTDAGMGAASLRVARPNVNLLNANDPDTHTPVICGEDFRRISHIVPGDGTRFELFIVQGFSSASLLGQAMVQGTDLAAPFRGTPPLAFAAIVRSNHAAGGLWDNADNWFQVIVHEATHSLAEVFHVSTNDPRRNHELMFNFATQQDSSVLDARRICDAPALVRYNKFKPGGVPIGATDNVATNMVERLREKSAPVQEGW
ncbi:MAG: hypothetical protein SFY95_04530 [Planctomycetota bacterium]|nr:hypothetical protein [Planctomycetota bacterium]